MLHNYVIMYVREHNKFIYILYHISGVGMEGGGGGAPGAGALPPPLPPPLLNFGEASSLVHMIVIIAIGAPAPHLKTSSYVCLCVFIVVCLFSPIKNCFLLKTKHFSSYATTFI